MTTLTPEQIAELHDDARRCAQLADLTYVLGDEPGLTRRRSGKGWRYADPDGHPLTDSAVKTRLAELAIPPAWKQVWICPHADGHILATGEDERGRKQYIYHPRWRALRDMLNFYRLLVFAEQLPQIREHVDAQLRRRTPDRDQVHAVMLAIIDASYIRIGNEVYAEENHSFGLSTLTREHVHVEGADVRFTFPAKSGKQWDVTLTDARIARVMKGLLEVATAPDSRVFAVDGGPVDSAEVNEVLREITGEHVTAKNFRTWGGTLAAFEYLRDRLDSDRSDKKIITEALDEAAETLGNTRAVARAHYVHPHVVETFNEHTFGDYLAAAKPAEGAHLSDSERQLIGFLQVLLDTEFELLQRGDADAARAGRSRSRRRSGALLGALVPGVRDVRRGGSAAGALAAVATGRADAAWLPGLQPWDAAAGLLLAREAGAVVGDLVGGDSAGRWPATGDVLAAAPGLFEALRGRLAPVYAA